MGKDWGAGAVPIFAARPACFLHGERNAEEGEGATGCGCRGAPYGGDAALLTCEAQEKSGGAPRWRCDGCSSGSGSSVFVIAARSAARDWLPSRAIRWASGALSEGSRGLLAAPRHVGPTTHLAAMKICRHCGWSVGVGARHDALARTQCRTMACFSSSCSEPRRG